MISNIAGIMWPVDTLLVYSVHCAVCCVWSLNVWEKVYNIQTTVYSLDCTLVSIHKTVLVKSVE